MKGRQLGHDREDGRAAYVDATGDEPGAVGLELLLRTPLGRHGAANPSRAAARRAPSTVRVGNALSTISLPAASGDPLSKGGFGSYSMLSWTSSGDHHGMLGHSHTPPRFVDDNMRISLLPCELRIFARWPF